MTGMRKPAGQYGLEAPGSPDVNAHIDTLLIQERKE